MNFDSRRNALLAVALTAVLLAGTMASFAVVGGAQDGTQNETAQSSTPPVVRGEPTLSVHLPQNEVQTGNVSQLELQVSNDADIIAGTGSQAVTTARSVSVEVTEDGPFDVKTGETAIGSVPDGQVVPTQIALEVPEDVEPGEYELEVELDYSYSNKIGGRNGEERDSETVTRDVTVVVPETSQFAITNLDDTLEVGQEGEITGTLEHAGDHTIDDAVLVVEPMTESVQVKDTRYALPDLSPTGAADFQYTADVPGTADAGPRQVRFTVEYTDDVGVPARSDAISERVTVDEQTDAFSIDDGDGVSIEAGETQQVTLELTNERSETLSNIDAKLYDDSPLTATDDEAFVSELGPGESATLKFEVEVDEDASAEAHPMELDFEYEDESGDTHLTDRYRQAIDVEPASDDGGGLSGTIIGVLAVISVAVAGVATWWVRK